MRLAPQLSRPVAVRAQAWRPWVDEGLRAALAAELDGLLTREALADLRSSST